MPSTSGVASMDKWSNCFPGLEGQFLQIRAYPVIFFGVVKGGGRWLSHSAYFDHCIDTGLSWGGVCMDGCHCKYRLNHKLFVLTQRNPSIFLLFRLTFIRLQLLNVYDFHVKRCDKRHAFRPKVLFSNLHIWYYLVVKILCIIIMKSVSRASPQTPPTLRPWTSLGDMDIRPETPNFAPEKNSQLRHRSARKGVFTADELN